MASARSGRNNYGIQLPGCRLVVERVQRRNMRQRQYLETLTQSLPVQFSYTYTAKAEFDTSFDSGFDPWGEVNAGDDLPYIPEHLFQAALGLVSGDWEVHLNGNYMDKTRTVAGSGPVPADESTDSFFVVDVVGKYWFTDSLNLALRIENLFDETALVSRRPAGLRPGKDRQVMLGVQFNF